MLQRAVSGSDLSATHFDDHKLRSQFKTLALQQPTNISAGPPIKRRKVEQGLSSLTRVMSALYGLLGLEHLGDYTGLGDAIKYMGQFTKEKQLRLTAGMQAQFQLT